MRTIFKFRTKLESNAEIMKAIFEIKSIIDTICENKGLDDSHDLCLASNHLNSFLDALESQLIKKVAKQGSVSK